MAVEEMDLRERAEVWGRIYDLLEAEGISIPEAVRFLAGDVQKEAIRDHVRQYEASDAFHAVLDEMESRHGVSRDLLLKAEKTAMDMVCVSEDDASRNAIAGLGRLERSMTWPPPDKGEAYSLGALAALSGLSATLHVELADGTHVPVDYVEAEDGKVIIGHRYAWGAWNASLDVLRSEMDDLKARVRRVEESA